MKDKKYEFIQRIEGHYVGEDCIQIMIPHYLNSPITILNSDGMTYHYKPNSPLFINKYTEDERKEQFPYSQIPSHQGKVRGKKLEYVNQILDFDRVYIEIADNIVKESYVIKDGKEALLATKYIEPKKEKIDYINREKATEFLNTFVGKMYSYEGCLWQTFPLPTEEYILKWYKDQLMGRRKLEMKSVYSEENKTISEFLNKKINELTINDVPDNITIVDNIIIPNIDNGEIQSVKSIVIKFMGADNYKIETYDFPITFYSLDHMKTLEHTNKLKTSEPRIARRLNKSIEREEIKKAKKLVLARKK